MPRRRCCARAVAVRSPAERSCTCAIAATGKLQTATIATRQRIANLLIRGAAPFHNNFGSAYGTTNSVMDCAGNVAVKVLLVLPEAGGVNAAALCATIPFKFALL